MTIIEAFISRGMSPEEAEAELNAMAEDLYERLYENAADPYEIAYDYGLEDDFAMDARLLAKVEKIRRERE